MQTPLSGTQPQGLPPAALAAFQAALHFASKQVPELSGSADSEDAAPRPRACTPVPSAPSTPRPGAVTTPRGQARSETSPLVSELDCSASCKATDDSPGQPCCSTPSQHDGDDDFAALLSPLAPSAPPAVLHRRLADLRLALRASLAREAAAHGQMRQSVSDGADARGKVTRLEASLCALEACDAMSKGGRLHDGTLDALRGSLLAHAHVQMKEHAAAAAQAAADALRASALVQEVQNARQADARAAATEVAALAEELATARATAQVHAQAAKEATAVAAADAQRAVSADATAVQALRRAEEAEKAASVAAQREASALASRDTALAAAAEANARAEWAEARAAALEATTTGFPGQMGGASMTASSYDAQLRQLRAQAAAERQRLEAALADALQGHGKAPAKAHTAFVDAEVQTALQPPDGYAIASREEIEQLHASIAELCAALEAERGRCVSLETQLQDTQRAVRSSAQDAASEAETRANEAWAARLGAIEAAAAEERGRLRAALTKAETAAAEAAAAALIDAPCLADAAQQTEAVVEAVVGERAPVVPFKVLHPAARPPLPLSLDADSAVSASPVATSAAVVDDAPAAPTPGRSVAAPPIAADSALSASRAALAQLYALLPHTADGSADVASLRYSPPCPVDSQYSGTPAPRARKGLMWSGVDASPSSASYIAALTPKGGHDKTSPVSVLSPGSLFGTVAVRGSAAALAMARAQEVAVRALAGTA